MPKHQFKSEISQLLQLIIHSLYSHKEIFLRELISNASDALDKLKYLTYTDENIKKLKFEPKIDIYFDEKDQKTLTISDNGIGMNEEELIENLGTIARSGTMRFLDNIKGATKIDLNLIGQFGVGFYSVFMIAGKVEVISRKVGETKAYKWISEGTSDYETGEAERNEQGTTIILHLNKEGKEYASRWRIEDIIKKYSNHVSFPIYLHYTETETDKDKKETKQEKSEQINDVTALWMQNKSKLTEKDYNEFYKTISMDTEDPFMYIHTRAEGKLEYTTLFYIPDKAPYDLFMVNYQAGIKLYIKRVFITDNEKELMPSYLRFLKGIIDSEDLPLNVSRETLQHNRVIENIKSASVKKILSEFHDLAKKDKAKYEKFYEKYGRCLKEGLYHDFANKETLLDLVRFKSTKVDGLTSFEEYKSRMKKGQKAIYYIMGVNEENVRNSPLLEVYKKEDIEVLLMTDEIDEIVMPMAGPFKKTDLKAVNQSDISEDIKKEKPEEKSDEVDSLIKKIKDVLKDDVKEVKISSRLSDSPSCIVMDKNDPSIQMQSMLRAMGQKADVIKPILEINPGHEIIKKMLKTTDEELLSDISRLLYEQAVLVEGGELKNPALFIKRFNKLMARAL